MQADGRCPLPTRDDGSPWGYEVDHIKTHSDGGVTAVSNLQVLCAICHSGKTSQEAKERVLAWSKRYATIRSLGGVVDRQYQPPP